MGMEKARGIHPVSATKTKYDELMGRLTESWNTVQRVREKTRKDAEVAREQVKKVEVAKAQEEIARLEKELAKIMSIQRKTNQPTQKEVDDIKATQVFIDSLKNSLGTVDLSEVKDLVTRQLGSVPQFIMKPKCLSKTIVEDTFVRLLNPEHAESDNEMRVVAKRIIDAKSIPADVKISENLRGPLKMALDLYNARKMPACKSQFQLDRDSALMPYQRLCGLLMWPEFDFRGFYILHPVGSGKTCTSLAAVTYLIDAARLRRNNGINSVYIIIPKERAIGDFKRDLFCNCGSRYIISNNNEGNKSITVDVKGSGSKIVIQFIEIRNDIEAQMGGRSFENSLVIFDEVQNCINPKKIESSQRNNVIGNAFQIRAKLLKTKHVKILLMSATPLEDDPSEIALLNMIKPQDADGNIKDPFPDEVIHFSSIEKTGKSWWGPNLDRIKKWRIDSFRKQFMQQNPESKEWVLLDDAPQRIEKMCEGMITYINMQLHGKGTIYPWVRVGSSRFINGPDTMEPLENGEELSETTELVENNDIENIKFFDTVYCRLNSEQYREATGGSLRKTKKTAAASTSPKKGWGRCDKRWIQNKTTLMPKATALVNMVVSLMEGRVAFFDNIVDDGTQDTVNGELANKQAVFCADNTAIESIAKALKATGKCDIIRLFDPKAKKEDAQDYMMDPFNWRRHMKDRAMANSVLKKLDDPTKEVSAQEQKASEQAQRDCVEEFFKRFPKGVKRFVVFEKPPGGTLTEGLRQIIVNTIFSDARNADGSYIHGIIFGESAREGSSFKQTTHMHVLDHGDKSRSNRGMRNQVMGRISRLYSHCDIEQKFVRYIYYVSVGPNDEPTVDFNAWMESSQKTVIETALDCIRKAAIDANLYGSPSSSSSGSDGAICSSASDWTVDYTLDAPQNSHIYRQKAPQFVSRLPPRQKSVSDLTVSMNCRQSSSEPIFINPAPWNDLYESGFQFLWQKFQDARWRSLQKDKLPLTREDVEWSKRELSTIFDGLAVAEVHQGIMVVAPEGGEVLVPIHVLAGRKDLGPNWWLNAVNANGVMTEFGLAPVNIDSFKKHIQSFTLADSIKNAQTPHKLGDGFKPRYHTNVEADLTNRVRQMTAGGSRSLLKNLFERNSDWSKAKDLWAMKGDLPTNYEAASQSEMEHALWMMMRLRGGLVREQQQMYVFETIALQRRKEEINKQIDLLKRAIN